MVNELVQTGFLLTLAGIVTMFIAFFLMFAGQARRGESRVKGGGAVLIGPIPIVWGTDKNWVFIAIALMLVVILLSFILPLLAR